MNAVAAPLRIAFTVYGQAAPAGSKRHVGGHRIIDASKRSAPWKNLVAEYAAAAMSDWGGTGVVLLDGALAVKMTFYVPRPKGHYSKRTGTPVPVTAGGMGVAQQAAADVSRRHEPPAAPLALSPEQGYESNRAGSGSAHPALLPSAPVWPTTRPDVLKLARAVEDACTGVVWRDDAQIVVETLVKKYGEPARVEIVVTEA